MSIAPSMQQARRTTVGSVAWRGACLCLFAALAARSANAPHYLSIEIPPPVGALLTSAGGVNDAGQMVGTYLLTDSRTIRPFIYQDTNQNHRFDASEMADLGGLPGTQSSEAADINNNGVISGDSFLQPGIAHAFRGPRGALVDLHPTGFTSSRGGALNEAGQMAGDGLRADGTTHTLRWDTNGSVIDCGLLPGGTLTRPTGINSLGQIAGYGDVTGGKFRAFFWDGQMHDLGTLGGAASTAAAINDSGVVVGFAQTAAGLTHACLWRDVTGDGKPDAQGIVDLSAPTENGSSATSINNQGDIVGHVQLPGQPRTPVFFVEGGSPVDLNAITTYSGVHGIQAAGGLTNTGYMVAYGSPNTIYGSAVILFPGSAPAGNGPDLTGSWSSITLTVSGPVGRPRSKITGAFVVRNIGTSSTGRRPRVRFYASTDAVLDVGDVQIGNLTARALAGGATQSFSLNLNVPRGISPSLLHGRVIIAVVDADRQVTETDENNNNAVSARLP